MVIRPIQQHKFSNINLFLIYATCFSHQQTGDMITVETSRIYEINVRKFMLLMIAFEDFLLMCWEYPCIQVLL